MIFTLRMSNCIGVSQEDIQRISMDQNMYLKCDNSDIEVQELY